jgi:leucyl aminopeptidase
MAELQITTVHTAPARIQTPLLVLQRFEGDAELSGLPAAVNDLFGGQLARVQERGDFTGRKDETVVLHAPDPATGIQRVLLVGVGKREDFTLERLRRGVGQAVRQAERLHVRELGIVLSHIEESSERLGAYFAAHGAVEAAVLAAWDYRDLKTSADEARRTPVTGVTLFATSAEQAGVFERAVRTGQIGGRAANLARGLAARPGNMATPTFLANTASTIAEKHGLKLTVLDRAAMQKEGMKALLAVAQGSLEEPRFIVMEYQAAGADVKPLVLVGKGVTFDAGGISIKPAERMEDMKYDMSGAAAVLGAMQGIAELGLKANVVALIPSTENLPSGSAFKPGDVIGSLLGKNIEIVNTDAEGRLILADALAYAGRYQPAAIVDAATLTGAIGVALGQHAIGLMGNDGDLIEEVRAVGLRVGERCWPLPLWDEYREQIDSHVADLKNSAGRLGGSITAAWFLKEFVGSVPWVHLDIAATAYRDEPVAPYLRKGPTGVPTRLFIEWVRARAEA